ncbi:4-hydroxythreonine-4-phosphate dehydrogenase PdxA [Algimonas porphyrae]|uniref:4-hydroxythreonine-4-phosphate dehydrogenase n=1 Tax=Algimonas porphyrae TaxID=1128113 RepID=A0ABQ5UYJ4_9PROT|nr:4-hydroxythreonine-4-phosphate dehydrogenase PdxA [Algimonas porphyrae]GLQ19917.1 4-hydroxythreonine-4-phosphate dehydrogenase [Algimonas porphyrae]
MKPLALTLGDPAGIGPEISWKAWERLRGEPDHAFALIAPPDALTQIDRADYPLRVIAQLGDAASVFDEALPVLPIDGSGARPGQPDPAHADTVTRSIRTAVELASDRQADAVVTNPIAKDVLYRAGFAFPGHTEYLGALCEGTDTPYHPGPVMMLSAPDDQGGKGQRLDLRVGLVTIHIPLCQTCDAITHQAVLDAARTMLGALCQDFGIQNPRLAVCGLNPHAGENGALGTEDRDVINPVCRLLRAEGHQVTDALPADTLFHAEARRSYDGVLAMYHDQGLIPVKTLDFHRGVNITLGLPIVRTSPDHGTAFDIAGQGIARPDSLIAAIRKAREIANYRHG